VSGLRDNPWQPPPQRIVVFRALQLGDMLCVVPALRALRSAAPHAHITLIGLPWARFFVQRFRHYIDDFLVFPGFPSFEEQEADIAALPQFLFDAQQYRFDVALQWHGNGTVSNVITSLLGAKYQAGFYRPDGYCPDSRYFVPWTENEPEVLRYLHLLEFLGVSSQGEKLEFPTRTPDTVALNAIFDVHALHPRSYVCVHAGARLASRRWSPARFARVADALSSRGYQVVLTGSDAERSIAQDLIARMRTSAIDLVGKTELGTLAALIAASRLLVCNDTGVSHIAAAVGVPSVVIACGSNVHRWAPLDRQRHRVLFHEVECRPCAHQVCPVGHLCAEGVSAEAVINEALRLLGEGIRHAS
jgi:ADP-heptose:LPS heptosyltransferase